MSQFRRKKSDITYENQILRAWEEPEPCYAYEKAWTFRAKNELWENNWGYQKRLWEIQPD